MEFDKNKRVRWVILMGHCCLALGLVACIQAGNGEVPSSQSEEDTGANSDYAMLRYMLSNLPGLEKLQTDVAALTSSEERVKARLKSGAMRPAEAAAELHTLARLHYQGRRNAEAIRLLELSVDAAPDSVVAGESWYLIGHICYGNLSDPARAIPAYEEADRIFASVLSEQGGLQGENRAAILKLRALTVGRLGASLMYRGEPEAAAIYLESLLKTPELAESLPPEALAVFAMDLVRSQEQSSDLEGARKNYAQIVQLLRSGQQPSEIRIYQQLELIRACWPDPLDKQRLSQLNELWKDETLLDLPEILLVGDELILAAYFQEPVTRSEFDTLTKEFVKRAKSVPRGAGEATVVERAILRGSLCEIDLAGQWGQSNRQAERVRECVTRFQGRRVSLGVQVAWGRERLLRLEGLYDRHLSSKMKPSPESPTTPPSAP